MSRLIDADVLSDQMYHEAFETDTEMQRWDSGCWIRYKMFENALRNAPTIEERKTGRWIPVTERLPDPEAKTYWVCTDTGYQCECRWTNVNILWTKQTTDWHWNFMDIPQYTEVTAWRPLPEPYKERREE